jgi:transitional endoplasmic reticulum ATPase
LIYIPLPDNEARIAIFTTSLKKLSVAKDVNMNYLAGVTEGFSGADLNEICQRAFKLAIKESIDREMKHQLEQQPSGQTRMESVEPAAGPEIRADHFIEVMKFARRSVQDKDINVCQMFAQELEKLRGDVGQLALIKKEKVIIYNLILRKTSPFFMFRLIVQK